MRPSAYVITGPRTALRRSIVAAGFQAGLFVSLLGALVVAGESPLLDAARRGDTDAVRLAIDRKADVRQTAGDGTTALHWAVHRDDAVMTDALLGAGARVNAVTDLGVSPLYLACTNRSDALVARLLEAGADPSLALPNGETVLMNCARTGAAAAIRALLARGARVNDRESAHDQTALMWAAAAVHPQAVAELLAAGADLRARSRVYSQVVTSEVTQRAGRETLNYTVQRGGMTALLFAARSGDADSVRLLAAAGADVNDAQADGLAALTLAAHSGQGAAALALIERGANVNDGRVGYTALHAAVLRADLAVVKALLAHGANPNVAMTKGTPMRRTSQDFDLPAALIPSTPYLLAARFLEPDIVRALGAGGADPAPAMRDGTTAVMLAAALGASATTDRRGVALIDGGRAATEALVLRTVDALSETGADIKAANQAGDTALHAAAAAGLDRVVARLVALGAPINARNGRGQTPLGAVTARRAPGAIERTSTIALLRSLGATE